MLGTRLLRRVDLRLREFMENNAAFGGLSVLILGDLLQLPPVKDRAIYLNDKSAYGNFTGTVNPLWAMFTIFELTEIMRQQTTVVSPSFSTFWASMASRVSTCSTRSEGGTKANPSPMRQIAMLNSRIMKEDSIPEDATFLYYTNKNVDSMNAERILKCPSPLVKSFAHDELRKKGVRQDEIDEDLLRQLKNYCSKLSGDNSDQIVYEVRNILYVWLTFQFDNNKCILT